METDIKKTLGNTEREIVEASKPDPTPLPKVFQ